MITDLLNKILFLVPDAKCCIRSDMSDADYAAASYANETVYPLNNFFVVWSPLNTSPWPGQDKVNAVTKNQSDNVQERARKKERNQNARNDLAIVSNFKAAKQANPALKFGDYLDGLEADAANIDPNA